MLNLFDVSGKSAVVTGAGSGIGAVAAETLIAAGASVVVTDIDGDAARATAERLSGQGASCEARVLDVTVERDVIALFADVADQYSGLDISVHSAGIARRAAALETELADFKKVIDVNLTGLFLCCREAARAMLASGGGSVINVSSIMGHSGGGIYPNPSYHASKGAVVNLTRALAVEWGPSGVRVNDIAPTWVNTPMPRKLLNDPSFRQPMEASMPLRRIAEVEDLSGAILYLASPASAMVTGHSLAVDGGYLAC